MSILITILIVLVLGVLGLLALLIKGDQAEKETKAAQSASINLLNQQLEAIRTSQDNHSQALQKNLTTSQQDIGKYLQTSMATIGDLNKQMGQLKSASDQMIQLGTDVRSLQDILKNPKLRGQMGEMSLENLLATVLPKASFAIQHTFKNGKIVDALVNMPDYSVPIDAKFPLPSFQAMIKAEDDQQKDKLRRQFQNDVTKHIDKIAESYILPDEGTLDFALMYIPAENIYYETVINCPSDKTDIVSYALEKKVIPVSPNLLYAYLMTIVMGLKGMQIEKQAAQIRRDLVKLNVDMDSFSSNWDVLGKHLRNAQAQYDEGGVKLGKFTSGLERIQNSGEEDENDL
jgi:DNA recombination protein RmuC